MLQRIKGCLPSVSGPYFMLITFYHRLIFRVLVQTNLMQMTQSILSKGFYNIQDVQLWNSVNYAAHGDNLPPLIISLAICKVSPILTGDRCRQQFSLNWHRDTCFGWVGDTHSRVSTQSLIAGKLSSERLKCHYDKNVEKTLMIFSNDITRFYMITF